MYLIPNPSRQDNDVAFRNTQIILSNHGVEFKQIKIPAVKNLRKLYEEYGGLRQIGEMLRKLKEDQGWEKTMVEVARVSNQHQEIICLFVSPHVNWRYLKDVSHAAYCGCSGCQNRMSRTAPLLTTDEPR